LTSWANERAASSKHRSKDKIARNVGLRPAAIFSDKCEAKSQPDGMFKKRWNDKMQETWVEDRILPTFSPNRCNVIRMTP
jgi:hypothetical protein